MVIYIYISLMLDIPDTTVDPCHRTQRLVEKLQTASHHYYIKDSESKKKTEARFISNSS